ncbi:sensor histidine kinase [Paenibacillus tarimensis]
MARRKYIPFGIKLMISYIVLIIFPIFIFGYIAHSIMVESIRAQTENNLTGTLKQIRDNIVYKQEDTKRISELLYYDDELSKRLKHYEEGWVSYESMDRYLQPKFRQTIDSTNRPMWLTIYLRNETLPEIYYNHRNMDPLLNKERFFEVKHLKRIEAKEWYASFPPEQYGKTIQWRQIEDDSKYGRISLLRRLVDTSNPTVIKEIGFMRISVYLSDVFRSIDNPNIAEGSVVMIRNGQSGVLYASGRDSEQPERDGTNGNYMSLQEDLPGFDWNLTMFIPLDALSEDTDKVGRLTLIVCLVCFSIIFIVSLIISRFFSRRVAKVKSVLQSFRQGEFQRRVYYSGNDEFTTIAVALNELGEHTQNLIEEVYLTNLRKKEAELETLQAQINPHFLYNTLSSISRLAKFGQVDKQHQMVMNLAKFYRLSLNEGQTIIPIYREIEQAQAYLDIQRIKYEDRLVVQFDVQAELARYETVKLILQPFIENVLIHAWCGDRIHIRIAGYVRQNSVVFQIIDDGIGMSEETITGIFNETSRSRTGYGIRNVNERIKLYFGNEYGVAIVSRPGIGTSVVIEIPAHRYRSSLSG